MGCLVKREMWVSLGLASLAKLVILVFLDYQCQVFVGQVDRKELKEKMACLVCQVQEETLGLIKYLAWDQWDYLELKDHQVILAH
ncbi:unnamed protein product [Menidia menidia]|uniref:(Atlantic silverside) hypothetical protein n=1 Tax=Menidia menidia TaxID=238744 RepID=A0A8S4AQK2_9TELE|nr:unnamed protein product [Menidia menidia]